MSQNNSDAMRRIGSAIHAGRLSHCIFLAGDAYECEELILYACSLLFKLPLERVKHSPDFHSFNGSDMRVATVLELLEVLLNPPLYNKRIIRIKNAGSMPEDVQNKLLKTLEEPEIHNHFFLYGNEEGLLPTIRSRCMRINLGQLTASDAAEYVKRLCGCSFEDALYYSGLADCDVERAVLLLTDKEFLGSYIAALDLILIIGEKSLITHRVDEYPNAILFFDVLYLCLCDMLYYYLGLELRTYTQEPYNSGIRSCADRLSMTQVIKIFDICIEARKMMLERIPQKQALVFFATNTEQVVK